MIALLCNFWWRFTQVSQQENEVLQLYIRGRYKYSAMSRNKKPIVSRSEMKRHMSESGKECCPVCSEEIEIFAVGVCDHTICYICSTRIRAVCEEMYCAICRGKLPWVSSCSIFITLNERAPGLPPIHWRCTRQRGNLLLKAYLFTPEMGRHIYYFCSEHST